MDELNNTAGTNYRYHNNAEAFGYSLWVDTENHLKTFVKMS